MTTTRVRAHERVREGKHEHVREHVRKVQGGAGGDGIYLSISASP